MKIKYIHIITKELFQFSLGTYLLLLMIEIIKLGFVNYFFSVNILLGIILLSGIVMALTIQEESETISVKNKKTGKGDILYIVFLSLAGGFLIYYKTYELGNASLLIGFFTACIIFLLSYLLLKAMPSASIIQSTKDHFTFFQKISEKINPASPSHSIFFHNKQLPHVDKARFEAIQMLHQIQEKSVKIAEQCKHVHLEHIYTEKTLPYITLVKDTLKKLSLYMSTDKEYDMIEEAIVKKKTMDIIPVNAKDVMQSIIQLENKKNETERGKTEKLLILYQHNLDLRVKQMENLLKSSV